MAYASRAGRAQISSTNPRAQAVCDRCGLWTNFHKLRNQVEWRGAALLPTYIYVCPQCWDVPQEQLRAIVVPADPLPIVQARVEAFVADETTYMTLNAPTTDPTTGLPIPSTTTMTTTAGIQMTVQPYGRPEGLQQPAIPPQYLTTHYGVSLAILSVMASGTDQIAVTCSAPHGLSTNQQVSVEGLSNSLATGFYSVTVTTATAFTYQTYSESIPSGSLLTSETSIVTALVGLPLDYPQIQQVGP